MAEGKFIRTVTYGGYDRSDVNKRFEYLYSKLYDLKNELRETKLAVEEYKKGTPEEKAHESVLAVERTKLTDELVQNEKLTLKLKAAEEDLKAREGRIAELEEENNKLVQQLEENKKKLSAYEAGNDTSALSTVFIEAQKSANAIEEKAKADAAERIEDAKKLAEDTVAEANNTAKQIIFDAEKRAAEIDAEARSNAEEMKSASGNLRTVLLSDIEKMTAEVGRLKEIFDDFEKNGKVSLESSSKVLDGAYKTLTEGGVPTFKVPEKFPPLYPDKPDLEPVNTDYKQNEDKAAKKKKSEDLEKLAAMAASLGGNESSKKKEAEKGNKADAVSLDDLAKLAGSLGNGDKSKKETAAAEEKKSGGVDLAELMKQAESLGKK